MKKLDENGETGCCKRFNPTPWQKKKIIFDHKLFLKDRVTSIFHIPINFGSVMKRSMEKVEKAGAACVDELVLSDENSLWGADVLIAVNKKIEGAEMAEISGEFLTDVFEGPFKNMGTWIKQMNSYVQAEGKNVQKLYYYYTTCPECAKAYGKNYVVLLAKV